MIKIKCAKCGNDIEFDRVKVVTYMFLFVLIGFILGFMIDPVEFAVEDGTMMLNKCYHGYCRDYIFMEKNTACYDGCKFTTQPIFRNMAENKSFRIEQYDACVKMCDDK